MVSNKIFALSCALVLLTCQYSLAQNLPNPRAINSTGLKVSTSSYSITYSVGEVAASKFSSTNNKVTEGVIQTDPISTVANSVISSEDLFIIYPNPTSDILKIETTYKDWTDYKIFSVDGRLVLNGTSCNEINTSSIASGTYILYINLDNTNLIVKQFIKK